MTILLIDASGLREGSVGLTTVGSPAQPSGRINMFQINGVANPMRTAFWLSNLASGVRAEH
jgi:hypothetical protein